MRRQTIAAPGKKQAQTHRNLIIDDNILRVCSALPYKVTEDGAAGVWGWIVSQMEGKSEVGLRVGFEIDVFGIASAHRGVVNWVG